LDLCLGLGLMSLNTEDGRRGGRRMSRGSTGGGRGFATIISEQVE